MHRILLAVIALVMVGGCANLAKDRTVCPEYRSLRCPAGESCSMDQGRGCRVCQCNPIDQMAPVTSPDQTQPPPIR